MRRGIHAVGVLVVAATVLTMVSGVAAGAPAGTELREGHGLAADIRYTEYGVPHIKARDFAGLGYGYGFAAAKDNLCVLADTYLTVDGERSKYLGPDAPANSAFGAAANSLASDLYFQQVNDSGVVERAVAAPAPKGPRAEVREIVRGYVAGYNRYLRATGVSRISDPACRGAAWVRPISELEVYRHFHAVSTIAGQGQVIDGIVGAAPSAGPSTPAPIPADAADRVRTALAENGVGSDMGSNAIAVGRDGTANGRGLLLGNPHYPWQGGRRFWQSQLTVPGKLDVSGGSLLGLPLIQIGFNKDVAWSHTVATATTFGLYQLTLAPGDPTSYLVDGKPERMTSRTVRVRVKDGTVERTLYSTRYGPVLGPVFGLPLDWTTSTAYAVRDANWGNLRGLNTWFELGRTRSTKDVVDVLSHTQGVPWVNTIATDQSGHALFADIQVAPNVTDELVARCDTPLGNALFPGSGISVLDGARTDCAWGSDPDALVPGIVGPSRMPVLTRTDYVENSNDSPWLSNPHQPITGYPRVMGDIGTERSPRTRMGITAVEEQLGSFTRKSMQDLLFADRSFVGERAAGAVAALCAALPGGLAPTADGGTVPVGRACTALADWDGTMRVGSRGALLFERFWLFAAGVPDLWRVPFDPADPVATPNTLNTANPLVAVALGEAIAELRTAGIAPDAPLGQNHYVVRNGERIPVPGGQNAHGVLNVITATWDPAAGDVEVVHGSSHIQVVSFTGSRCPDAATLLTYSQSSDPSSPHFADQTKLFSAGKWVRSRFCEQDILASPTLRVVLLRQ